MSAKLYFLHETKRREKEVTVLVENCDIQTGLKLLFCYVTENQALFYCLGMTRDIILINFNTGTNEDMGGSTVQPLYAKTSVSAPVPD